MAVAAFSYVGGDKQVNTEKVQPVTVEATKPTANNASQRQTDSPKPSPAVEVKRIEVQPTARTIEETTAAIAAQIESYLRSTGRSLQFSTDSSSGRTVISVRDATTGELIRQIPSEEALRLSQALGSQPNSLIDILA
jgi:flagellar protein FlaG